MAQHTLIVITILWFPQALSQILLWTYWLQVKEYRFDRFRSFAATSDGRKKILLFPVLSKLSLLIAALYMPLVLVLYLLIMLSIDLNTFILAMRHELRKPVFTLRARRIIATICISLFTFLAILFSTQNIIYALFSSELLLVFTPFLGIIWTKPLVEKARQREIAKAKEILLNIKPKVIGITGSYGKSTTKEFTATLLENKFITEKTTKNENTDFGIVRKVINDFKKNTEIFVVEMGAYKKGEIAKLSDIVQPSMGMLTGIEPQHIDLFGSLENIKAAKFELIKSLPKNGIALFNISNRDVFDLSEKARKLSTNLTVLTYALRKNIKINDHRANATMQSIISESTRDGISFRIYDGEKQRELFAPVHGIHFVENLTGAILLARTVGVSWQEIKKQIVKVKTPPGTMEVQTLNYGAVLIDDSYNVTPSGFMSALEYLEYFKGKKKAVITPGIIELGDESQKVHNKLGKLLKSVDRVFVTSPETALFIKQGLGSDVQKLKLVEDPEHLVEFTEGLIQNGFVLLIEGRISQKVMDYLENRKND